MRINNIGGNTAFGRVIKLNAPKERVEFSETDRKFGSLYELQKVLNSEKTDIYTRGEANKIREFFKNILGDYDGKRGVMITKAYGDTVILSGEDVKKVAELEKKHGIIYDVSSEKADGTRKSRKAREKQTRAENNQKARVAIAKEIQKRNENGENNKPETGINLAFKTNQRNGINRIDTAKFGGFEYASMHLINVPKKHKDHPKAGQLTVFRSVSYEEDKLNI